MITHIGFGQFGFGPGYFGLELQSSVFMPTPNGSLDKMLKWQLI
jgi:hypothetical protein